MDGAHELELVRKAQRGDHASYGTLVDLYGGAVLAIAYSRVGNFQISQDIAQDTFLLGFENLGKLRSPNRFGAWLKTIARNLCANWHKSESYRKRLHEDSAALHARLGYENGAAADERMEHDEMRNLIDQALDCLSVGDREAIVLYYFEEQSIGDAAKTFGISPVAMRKRLERARNRLRDALSAHVETELVEAGRRRKMSGRVLAALPFGAVFPKIAPVTAVLPVAPVLQFGRLLAKVGTSVVEMNKTTVAITAAALVVAGVLVVPAVHRPTQKAVAPPVETAQPLSPRQELQEFPEPARPEVAVVASGDIEKPTVSPVPEAEEPVAPSISGTIHDADGNLLPGARVEARVRCERFEVFRPPVIADETETGPEGTYALAALPAGEEMLVFATHPDWAHGAAHVKPLDESEYRRDVDVTLERPATASGIVTDEVGRSIAGATVSVWGVDRDPSLDDRGPSGIVHAGRYGCFARTTTASNGRFILTHLPEGRVVVGIHATKAGFAVNYAYSKESALKGERELSSGKSTSWGALDMPLPCDDVKITLRRGGSITGRVVRSDGLGFVADALVTAAGSMREPGLDHGVSYSISTRTDAAGSYLVDDLPQAELNVQARQGNLVSDVRRVAVDSGEVVSVADLELQVSGTIEGTVYDAEMGQPIPHHVIMYMKKGTVGGIPNTQADDNGMYRAEGLQPGEWSVWPAYGEWRLAKSHHPSAGESRGITVTVRSGETAENVDLYLEKAEDEPLGRVRGRVVDAAGNPVAGVTVLIREHGQYKDSRRKGSTDQQGEYSVVRLEPGSYDLIALDPASMTYGTTLAEIAAEAETVADIELQDKAAQIGGKVLDNTGQPVGVRVFVYVRGGGFTFEPTPDELGAYTCGPLPLGTYRVSAGVREGYRVRPRDEHRVRLDPGDRLDDVDFELVPMSGFLAGTVSYPDGTPATEKFVAVGGYEGLVRGSTDANGHFRVENIDGEHLYVQVGQPGRFGNKGDEEWLYIDGFAAGIDDVQLVLCPLGMLRGEVTLPDDDSFQVRASISGQLGFSDHVQFDDGLFEFSLQPDTYTLTIYSPLGTHTEESIVVESGEVTDLGHVLSLVPANGAILGTILVNGVLLSTDKFEVDVNVLRQDISGDYPPSSRDADVSHDGQYRLGHLDPGVYLVGIAVVPKGSERSARFTSQSAEVEDGVETRIDFDIHIGEIEITGTIPDGFEVERTAVFVFEPGTCTIKAGEHMSEHAMANGVAIGLVQSDGTFTIEGLPSGTFDVVTVQIDEDQICTDLDIQNMTLTP